MRRIKIVFTFSAILLIVSSCRNENSKDSAVEKEYVELPADKYNAVELNNQVTSIQKGALSLVDSVFRADTALIYRKIEDAIFELDVSINRLNSLGEEHKIAAYFTESVSGLLMFYKNEFETDFKILVPILKKKIYTEEDKIKLNSYDEEFVSHEADLFHEIVIRQDSFAKFFNIGLID
jgi:translation initiation factor 2 beta subunit (eIF-2beta)/eIF-5